MIDEVYRRWATLTEEERADSAALIEASSEEELAEGIAGMEVAALAGDAAEDELLAAAGALLLAGVPDGTIPEVEAWVSEADNSQAAALAALAAELRRPRSDQRKTLLEALRRHGG